MVEVVVEAMDHPEVAVPMLKVEVARVVKVAEAPHLPVLCKRALDI